MPISRIVKPTTLQATVYAELRASLIRGHFDPRQALVAQSLAEGIASAGLLSRAKTWFAQTS